ncbi:MAG: Ig-like domain-containing protein [Muribaculum sp.]|nr:Ig-like domain-containing protein [Muribaculum sp.]
MLKRLLAFTLAGCLILDATPVTGRAAGFPTEAVVMETESAPAGTTDGSEGTDLADGQYLTDAKPAAEDERLPLTKNADGSYSFETEDYRVNVKPDAGSLFLRFTVSLEAKGEMPDTAYNFPFRVYYKKSGSSEAPVEEPISLSHALNYVARDDFIRIEGGESYDVYFALKDYGSSADTTLGTTEAIVMQTQKTDKKLVCHGVSQTETEITFDLESDQNVVCYYAPADGSKEEQSVYLYRGWYDKTLTGLQPGTEYNIRFVSNYSVTLWETRVSTEETATQVDWQIVDAVDTFGLTVKADVSKYAGTASGFTMHCAYTDALGGEQDFSRWFSLYGNNVTTAEDGTKSFSGEWTFAEGLVADTAYDITVWLEGDGIVYGKETKTVTTPAARYMAEDIEFTVRQSESNPKTVEVRVVNNAEGENANRTAYLYYRREGDKAAYRKQETIISSIAPNLIYLPQLEYGAVYHYVFLIGGLKKEWTGSFGEPEVRLTAVGEGEDNAFDLVRTWKAEPAEGAEALSGDYKLTLYYLAGGSYQTLGSIVLNEENAYQAEFRTAAFGVLMADTDYELKWVVGKSDAVNTSDAVLHTVYESVHTRRAEITVEDAGDIDWDDRRYTVSIAPEDMEQLAQHSRALPIYGWIRKAGSGAFRQSGSLQLSATDDFSGSLMFRNLEPGTEYEVSLRSPVNYGVSAEYWTGKFTTPKDERTVAVTRKTAKLYSVTLDYTLSQILPEADYAYVACFIREQGEGNEWERASYNHSYNGTNGHNGSYVIDSYNGKELKENTAYEYQIGFTSTYNASLSDLEKAVPGEFATAEDQRSLSGAGVSAGYATVQAGAMLVGNDYNVNTYIYFFYREQGAESWLKASYWVTSGNAVEYTRTVEDLKPGTAYEYVMVIANNASCDSPEDVESERRKESGTFTTKKASYTLDFALDESRLTYNKAVVRVSAKGSTEDGSVEAALELNTGLSASVNLKRSAGYTRTAAFTGLLGGTEYTVVKAVLSVTENGRKVAIAELPCDFKFTTKEAQAPTALVLSEEAIGLNAAGGADGPFYEGYNQKTLRVKMTPETAATGFVWESSNPEVASVQNGVVSAKGVGEAKITVKSVYDENVSASCDVTVKNYVAGRVTWQTNPQILSYTASQYIYKGEYLEGLGLYEQTSTVSGDDGGAGTLVPLSGYEVTAEKEGIVSWDKETGRLQALSVGSTRIYLEKDGVKASFSVTVRAVARGFGISGFSCGSNEYSAVAGEEEGSYILACVPGITYQTKLQVGPAQALYFYGEFEWTVSDESVAKVDSLGKVTPVKAGDVTLTVTPNKTYTPEKLEIPLHIRELPKTGEEDALFALANDGGKIGDVPFPDTWAEGWAWRRPDTPLVTNGVYSDNQYLFEAVYQDEKNAAERFYPLERTLKVYIGRITGVSVQEIVADNAHNHALEVSGETAAGADTLSLAVNPLWQGKTQTAAYTIEIPEINGLTVASRPTAGSYDVTAQKAGKYTLKIAVKSKGTDKVLAQTTYQINAVEQKQAASILIQPDENSVADGVVMNQNGDILFTSTGEKNFTKNFTLKAVVRDRSGQELDTALEWKSSDKSVAAVAADKKDTHTVNVTVKGEGHTVITATAKDAGKYSVTFNLEVQNHRPRVDTDKATVNIAYDYTDYTGKSYAAAAGAVEIVPVYGESIQSVSLCDENGQARTDLTASRYDSTRYLIMPVGEEMPTGTYSCKLLVVTDTGAEYTYSLKVTVVDKSPSVSAKMGTAPNLFFTDSVGRIRLTIGDNRYVERVAWEDQSEGVNNGFAMTSGYYISKNKYVSYVDVKQQPDLGVADKKLTDGGVAQGTLTVKVRGYRKYYTFDNFKVKYTYKKPSIVTQSASSTVVPAVGQYEGEFRFYDKTNKRYLYYDESGGGNDEFDELTWDSETVELSPIYRAVLFRYSGKAGTQKLAMTLDSVSWREPVQTTHTIKPIQPKAYLSASRLDFNTAVEGRDSTNVYLKNTGYYYNLNCSDLVVVGANAKSKRLLEKDLLIITTDNKTVTVESSKAGLLEEKAAAGTYSFKVTPYCENPETGERTALNTLTLKIRLIHKPAAAKVSPKGTLDLTYGVASTPYDKKNCVVLVDPKFSNLSSDYFVSSYKLTGEYSDYFSLNYSAIRYGNTYGNHYYIAVKDRTSCKLKAGQTYKLAIEYTISLRNGETIQVTSNTFKIKPKQKAVKVTVQNNNQTLYAGAGGTLNRTCRLSVPSYYTISGASGSIDCNKDGKADITVSGNSTVTIRIVDADAVGASASGKSYSIPVTVRLSGRDGVSKDVKTTIKVKVKR